MKFFLKKMMSHVDKIPSLEDKASVVVALNLCQGSSFKEVALCLEKPVHGNFSPHTDPEKLKACYKMLKNDPCLLFFEFSPLNPKEKVEGWEAAIEDLCQTLMQSVPLHLKQGVRAWMNRIAWEYLSYSRRLEKLFGVSRYFLMNYLTREDWKENCRLDEKRLAERLIQDQYLTILQKYRVACIYCLYPSIPLFWKRLTEAKRRSLMASLDYEPLSFLEEEHRLVVLWSWFMDEQKKKRVQFDLWNLLTREAMIYGNQAAVMLCWKKLSKCDQQEIVSKMAISCYAAWQNIKQESHRYVSYKECLILNKLPTFKFASIRYFNLPSYYSELMHFFLFEMDEEQQLTFFKQRYEKKHFPFILECCLDWPLQDFFLQTINRLWGIIPKDVYGHCLLTLAGKYSENLEKENFYYDYRNLLCTLWEKTPEEYKQFVFNDEDSQEFKKEFLSCLLERSPYHEKDENLFKMFFYCLSQEDRSEMMLSKAGENICLLLTKKEKWSFLDCLLKESLPEEEIPRFKKQFMHSECSVELCSYQLIENCEMFVKDLINWSFALESEKNEYKYKLIGEGLSICVNACRSLLREGKFDEVERMINFCASSDERKEHLKMILAMYTCNQALENDFNFENLYQHMNEILAWSCGLSGNTQELKRDLLSNAGIIRHFKLVFSLRFWEEVKIFYKWFALSPDEIIKLKKDTVFSYTAIVHIKDTLYINPDMLKGPLFWCLTDEEMAIDLKKEVETLFGPVLDERQKKAKEAFGDLMSDVLCNLNKRPRIS